MEKVVSKWLIILMAALVPYISLAFGDDEKKPNRKIVVLKPEGKKPSKYPKNSKLDSLVLEKNTEDTLTFDEKNEKDDTLIFADDEINLNGPTKEDDSDFSLINKGGGVININPIIYPNPSYGITQISINGGEDTESEIIITSIDGTLIKKVKTTEKSYELTDLPVGNYIIHIKNKNQVVQKKLLVK